MTGDDGREPTAADLVDLTRELASKLQVFAATCAGAAGLSQPDLLALTSAVRAGGVTGIELRRLLGMTSSSVTELADRLERGGLVSRRRSTSDRRLTLIKPTARGRRLIARVQGQALENLQAVAEGVPVGDRELVVRYLGDVGRVLDDARPAAGRANSKRRGSRAAR